MLSTCKTYGATGRRWQTHSTEGRFYVETDETRTAKVRLVKENKPAFMLRLFRTFLAGRSSEKYDARKIGEDIYDFTDGYGAHYADRNSSNTYPVIFHTDRHGVQMMFTYSEMREIMNTVAHVPNKQEAKLKRQKLAKQKV